MDRDDQAPEKPNHLGHRERLRTQVLESGAQSLHDYEVLEYLLFAAIRRGDTKSQAKALIARFGSLGGVLGADPRDMEAVTNVGKSSAAVLKVVHEAAKRMAREEIVERELVSSWDKLLDYCRTMLAHEAVERFHLLFLDKKNRLIRDETQQRGTVDHTPVYPREVVKRALELGATALILVHNHPSGDAAPSRADIEMTRELAEAAAKLGITVHDHVIIAKSGHTSFRASGLL